MNPLRSLTYNTAHNSFPFSKITTAHIEEAIQLGITEEEQEIAAITANTAAPTFENTIIALTESGALLERATTVMYNLLSAHRNDELDELSEKMSPLLSAHSSNIMLNEALFARIKVVYEAECAKATPALDEEEMMLLRKTYEGFEKSGATLSPEKKERFRSLKAELSQLSLQFSQNNIKETNAFRLHLTKESQLSGLPESQKEQAAATAAEQGLEGWVFTLHAPSYVPFLQYADDRSLREELYRAYMSKCAKANEQNNFEICRNLVNLRLELAQLLGYDNYAAYVLKNRMAQHEANLRSLFDDLQQHYFPLAQKDLQAITALAREMRGDQDFVLQAWDLSYYAHKLQLRDYNLDSEMLRPYLELSQVTKGVFDLATRLYGISFVETTDVELYHPEVKTYEVLDKDGTFLALLYTDFFPRESKQNGAWMTSYREQYRDHQGNHRPHVSIVMNFSKPTPTKPALLTFSELQTFLHEFGHALHGIFANTRFAALSGTNVYWDFVELPSQFMENFALQSDFLKTFAHHYLTGETMPDELIARIHKSRNFNVGYACIRQLSLGLLDMAYYSRTQPLTTSLIDFEREVWQDLQLMPTVEGACMSVQFGHIMSGGYAAGYYSYKWSEVLDADAFEAFAKRGIFSTEMAQSFRQNILSRGGTAHPAELYQAFRGKEASIEALLKRDGIGS